MIRFPFSKPKPDGSEPEAAAADDIGSEAARDAVQEPARDARSRLEAPLSHEDMGEPGGGPEAVSAVVDEDLGPPSIAGAPSMAEQVRMVEAMLFASEKPLSTAELSARMPVGSDAAVAVRRLEENYQGRGVILARVAGKWAFRTAADLAWLLAGEAVESRKLSRAALETLAIIAYHQPVTRAEIEEIRQVGVSKGTVDLLMELQWVKLGRRRQTPGRPVTFVTTELFLEKFALETLKDLPRLDELRQAGLLENRPPVGFTGPMPAAGDELEAVPGPYDGADQDEDEDGDGRSEGRRGEADLLL